MMRLTFPKDDLAILKDFIEQRLEQLSEAEGVILGLESDSENQAEPLKGLFRIFHTLKGNAGFLNLAAIESLSHKVEALIEVFQKRDGAVLDSRTTECLLKSRDMIVTLLQHLNDGIRKVKQEGDLAIIEYEAQDTSEILDWLGREIERTQKEISEAPSRVPPPKIPAGRPNPLGARIIEQLGIFEKELKAVPVRDLRQSALDGWPQPLETAIALGKDLGDREVMGLLESALNILQFLQNIWPEPQDREILIEEIEQSVQACEDKLLWLTENETGEISAPPGDEVPPPQSFENIFFKVSQEQLNELMAMVGDLLVNRNVLEYLAANISAPGGQPDIGDRIKRVSQNIYTISRSLQDSVIAVRMTPINSVISKFPRLVRDLAKRLGKKIHFRVTGAETKLDRSIIGAVNDPLLHLIRNAADHGLEGPEERVAAGKPETGVIALRAYSEGQTVIVEISDDGRGIDAGRVKEKVLAQGLVDREKLEEMTDSEVYNLIFYSGLSTSEKLSKVSGRGVGMDVVKKEIDAVAGSVEIGSAPGKGTKVLLRLPLTLAISRGLRVSAGGERFYLPLEYVAEAVKISAGAVRRYREHSFFDYRGTVIPVFDLAGLLGLSGSASPPEEPDIFSLVIITLRKGRIAYKVERFYKEDEYLLKPLPGHINESPWIRGTMTTPEGRLVLVLDPPVLHSD